MAGAPTTEYSNLGISEYPLYFILFTVSAVLVQAVPYYIKNRHLWNSGPKKPTPAFINATNSFFSSSRATCAMVAFATFWFEAVQVSAKKKRQRQSVDIANKQNMSSKCLNQANSARKAINQREKNKPRAELVGFPPCCCKRTLQPCLRFCFPDTNLEPAGLAENPSFIPVFLATPRSRF